MLKVIWRSGYGVFRMLVVAAAAVVVTLTCCSIASAALMVDRVDERAAARAFEAAPPGVPADLSRDAIYDSVDGEPAFVYYWRIENPGASIPGIPPTAEDGQWFVSPELLRRMALDPLLQSRFPDALAIGDDGIGAADELVAYRLVGANVELHERLLASRGSGWIGLNAGVDNIVVLLGGAGILLTVGVGFLTAALGPATVGLERRLSLLTAIGATRPVLWAVAAAATAIVVLPASAVAAVMWYFIAPRLQSVPLVGQQVLSGDLKIPMWLCAIIVVAVTAIASALGSRRVPRQSGSRPTVRAPKAPSLWRTVPLVGSVALIAYATTRSGTEAVRGLLTGLLAASLCVVFALPVLIHWVGKAISARKSTLRLLLGRRLSWSPATSTRPLMILAALAVILPVGASYIAVSRADDPAPADGPASTIQVNGDIDLATLEGLENKAGGVFANVYATMPSGNEAPQFTWVASCQSLSGHLPIDSCGPEGIQVHPSAADAFAGIDAGATTPPRDTTPVFRLFITNDLKQAEAVLRSFVVNSERTDLSITTHEDRRPKEPRTVAWIVTGLQVSAAGAFAALLLWVATAASTTAGTRFRLASIGAQLPIIRRLAAAESALTIAIVGFASTAIGTIGAIAYALVDGTVTPNYWPSLALTTAVLVAAATAGLASAFEVTAEEARAATNARD